MNELHSVDLVLARARTGLSPSDAQLRQLDARVLGLPLAAAAGAPTAARTGRWAAFKATGGAGVVVAAALVTGGFLAGYLARTLPAPSETARALASAPAAAPDVTPTIAPVATTPSVPTAEPVARSERSRERREGRASAERQLAAQSPPDVTAELALLERIDRALRNADAPYALALLDELERRHPKTRLAEERRAARLMAACLAGSDGASVAASNFLGAHPASVYASRLHAVCDGK